MTCTCANVYLNGSERRETVGKNWNPDCPEHGTESEWWKSPEQVEKRRVQNERLRDLQARARAARAALSNSTDVES